MVEVFEGAPAEVKHELNKWFAADQAIAVQWAMQCAVPGGIAVTVIYTEEE